MHLAGGAGDQDRVLVAEIPAARERLAKGGQRVGDRAADLLGVGRRQQRPLGVRRPDAAGRRSGCRPRASARRPARTVDGVGAVQGRGPAPTPAPPAAPP